MLKELIGVWRHRGIMMKAVDLFGAMVGDCAEIFTRSWSVFSGEATIDSERKDIHDRDIQVNKKEREIRRLLVEHLTINPGQDASGCLALMSMVKDAERIGDYCKNIFDLAEMGHDNFKSMRHFSELAEVQKRLEEMLINLKGAFMESDEQKARAILESYKQTKDRCNKVLKSLFEEDMSKDEALITVLLARYLKRINSHASNVASGIILPLDKIDFVRVGLLS